MTISTICRRCKEPIIAVDEDDLVAQVHEHARAHGKHVPSREHILVGAQRDTPERTTEIQQGSQ